MASFSKLVSEVQRRGEFDERFPVAGEGQLEDEADYAVVVVLDLSGEALAGVEDQRLEAFVDRRALVADVGGGLAVLKVAWACGPEEAGGGRRGGSLRRRRTGSGPGPSRGAGRRARRCVGGLRGSWPFRGYDRA